MTFHVRDMIDFYRSPIWICCACALCAATNVQAAGPDVQALASAIASRAPPQLEWTGETGLTARTSAKGNGLIVSGHCRDDRPVVISGKSIREPIQVACSAGGYSAELSGIVAKTPGEVIASQIMLDGNILAARVVHSPAVGAERHVTPADLKTALASAQPGDRLVISPGTYMDMTLDLSGRGGTPDRPIVIDGNQAVMFSGSNRILISASYVTLRGLKFINNNQDAVIISGKGVRLTESVFDHCGNPQKTQAECVIVGVGGANSELDFNTFTGSTSMSLKVRAGPDSERDQPFDVSIHHNVFRDIARLSQNGQEPIQIAGPGGAGSGISLRTRVEHNLFYRADGDREAISLKTPGLTLRWNVFRDMDAAPNIRGSRDDTVTDNLLIRTRPVRVAGQNHRIENNIILCPSQGVGFVISHGSPGYEVAANNIVEDNIVATSRIGILIGAQTQPLEEPAHGNRFARNQFYLPRSRPIYEFRPPSDASALQAANSMAPLEPGPVLCP